MRKVLSLAGKKFPHQFFITVTIVWYCLFCPFILLGQGDLFVYPKRVVFEKTQRYQEFNLANTGSDTARYSISVLQMKMKEDGGFEIMDGPEPGHKFAHEHFRFFPRNVVLGPNESQVLKMQITNVKQLESGEYRSHLYFRSEPKINPLDESITDKDTTAVRIRITPIFGITIPVIIRKGMVDVKVRILDSSIEMVQARPVLNLILERVGNISVYGDILIEYIGGKSKKSTSVGKIKGLAVYTPNILRHIQLGLEQKEGVDFKKGMLRVTYSDKNQVYLRKVIEL